MKMLILAGEESGRLYATRLAEILRRDVPGIAIRGYDDYGFHTADMAVMGFWAVLRRLPYFLRVARVMKRAIREWRPDAVVTIDYPDMNFRLARAAKEQGIPAIHMVCPQVWAWRRGRIPKIVASISTLLCFMPFEPEVFAGTGLDARFIGHPLADDFANESEQGRRRGLVALLPGSRLAEIRGFLPRLLEAVEGMDYEIPAANTRAMREILRYAPAERVRLGGARELLRRADCAVAASGTVTPEAALARCPTVIVYSVAPLLAWILRRMITGVKHIGLANVIAEKAGARPPMPELLQEDFTSAAVRAQLRKWLDDRTARAAAADALDGTMALLESGSGGALEKAVRIIREKASEAQGARA